MTLQTLTYTYLFLRALTCILGCFPFKREPWRSRFASCKILLKALRSLNKVSKVSSPHRLYRALETLTFLQGST